KPDLQQAMVHYYDFLTGYEDLLQDGGTLDQPDLVSADGKVVLSNWSPQPGAVSMVGKDMGGREVIQLINLANATTFDWRDANANQRVPNTILNAAFIFTARRPVKKLWYATPDADGGVAKQLSFSSSGNTISFALPSLQYWDMVVAEYQ
ncbi:MAG TPA: glycoside hydrolase family 66 protein, partial [Puia sp.]|nr:glycoside hydrolase family 66 protein [Puia sp.]